MSAGKFLREKRKEKNYGIKTAAKELHVDYTFLSKIENDKRSINSELINKISKLYGIDQDELIARYKRLPPDIELILEEKGKEVFELIRKNYSVNKK